MRAMTLGRREMDDCSEINGVLLWGAGSQGKLLAKLLEESLPPNKTDFVVFDPTSLALQKQPDGTVQGIEALRERLSKLSHHVIAIGAEHGSARVEIGRQLEKLGLEPLSVISHHSHVASSARLGKGAVIMPGATVNHFATLGDYCIVNTNASVDHECRLEDGVHIMGAAAIAGRVTIECFASIGTNSTVLPDLTVGSHATVGAGAVVTRAVASGAIVTGIPAKETGQMERKPTYPDQDWFIALGSHLEAN